MKKVSIITDDKELISELKAQSSNLFDFHLLNGSDDVTAQVVASKPDIILVDFLLEHANGGALTHQVKAELSLNSVPVFLLSEFPDTEQFTTKFGCNSVIHKPITASELIDTLNIFFATTA